MPRATDKTAAPAEAPAPAQEPTVPVSVVSELVAQIEALKAQVSSMQPVANGAGIEDTLQLKPRVPVVTANGNTRVDF